MSTDPNAPICTYYQRGTCRFGWACRNRHIGNIPQNPQPAASGMQGGAGSNTGGGWGNTTGGGWGNTTGGGWGNTTGGGWGGNAADGGWGSSGNTAAAGAWGGTAGNTQTGFGSSGQGVNAFGQPAANTTGNNGPAAGQQSTQNAGAKEAALLAADMHDTLHGGGWPLTSYSVYKHEPCIIEGLDVSPDEVRVEYYRLRNVPGGLQQYENMWNSAVANARAQYTEDPHRLAQILAEADRRRQMNEASKSQDPDPGAGGAQAGSALGLVGMDPPKPALGAGVGSAFGPGGMGPAQQTNAFGQPQPQQPGTSAFGQPQQQQGTNAFGQPQPQSQPQQQQTTGSAFGPGGMGPAQPTNAFSQQQTGTNAFGQPAQQNAFGQPTQQPPATNAFGQPTQQTNAFGQPQPQPATNAFGQSPQQTNAFGQPTQQTNAFGQPQPQPPPNNFAQPPPPPQPFGTISAFGPGGAGPPQSQSQSQAQAQAQAGFGAFSNPQAPTQQKITIKYRQRPLVPDFINPFPGKPRWEPGPPPSFDPEAGHLLPPELRSKYKRPTWPESDAARSRVATAWSMLPKEFVSECEEVWRAEKFEYGKIPGLPPASAYR